MIDLKYIQDQFLYYWDKLCNKTHLFFSWILPDDYNSCYTFSDEIKDHVCDCCLDKKYVPPEVSVTTKDVSIVIDPPEPISEISPLKSNGEDVSFNLKDDISSLDSEEWDKIDDMKES